MSAVQVILLCILVIPVFGVTARLALPPTVDAIVRIHGIFVQAAPAQEIETRVVLLEEEIRRLRSSVGARIATTHLLRGQTYARYPRGSGQRVDLFGPIHSFGEQQPLSGCN